MDSVAILRASIDLSHVLLPGATAFVFFPYAASAAHGMVSGKDQPQHVWFGANIFLVALGAAAHRSFWAYIRIVGRTPENWEDIERVSQYWELWLLVVCLGYAGHLRSALGPGHWLPRLALLVPALSFVALLAIIGLGR